MLFAAVATVLWKALAPSTDWNFLGTVFYLIVAVSWAVLILSKFWTDRRGDGWSRRIILMVVGGLIGFGALWLDGWSPGEAPPPNLTPDVPASVVSSIAPSGVLNEASYISYFGLAFFACGGGAWPTVAAPSGSASPRCWRRRSGAWCCCWWAGSRCGTAPAC